MRPEAAEALAHRYHTEIADVVAGANLLPHNPGVIAEIMAPDFVVHLNSQEIRGMEGLEQLTSIQRTAFPDARITHHETVVADDRVVIRWSTDATHMGQFGDVHATGKQIHLEGLDLFHLRGGSKWVSSLRQTRLRKWVLSPVLLTTAGPLPKIITSGNLIL
jgi:predicted ester cyclase